MTLQDTWRRWAQRLRREALTLWFACRHPRTPWWAKALGALGVAYALSPIDLIPDFIPVLGLLEEMLLLPALVWLLMRCLPADVVRECRQQAQAHLAAGATKPRSWGGAVLIVGVWLLGVLLLALWGWQRHR